MVIPVYDDDPLDRETRPYVTVAIIAANIILFAFGYVASPNTQVTMERALPLVPAALTGYALPPSDLPPELTLVTYMFLHGGWMHLVGNMLFLWVFGDNIEDAIGHVRFAVFYFACGIVGGLVHILSAPASTVPLIGASGAVAGVVAAYLMIRPCARVTVLLFGGIPLRLASYWVLGFWVLTQIWNVVVGDMSSTAWWAHIGGMGAGALLIVFLRPAHVLLFECVKPLPAVAAPRLDERLPR
jgi:membrane associated rhomboid family serine protease